MSTVPTQHPPWCLLPACTIAAGGMHRSSARLVPEASPLGRTVALDLVQGVDGEPRIRLAEDGVHILELPAHAARDLARALRDLAYAGRRAEQ